MIKRSIAVYPLFPNIGVINGIRERYDPLSGLVVPHITLVFPFESELAAAQIRPHLMNRMLYVNPFQLVLKGFSTDETGQWLFLNVETGNDELIHMHRALYTGLLEPFVPQWLKEHGYQPHMTVGRFADAGQCAAALRECNGITGTFDTVIDRVGVEIIGANEESQMETVVYL